MSVLGGTVRAGAAGFARPLAEPAVLMAVVGAALALSATRRLVDRERVSRS